MKLSIQTKALIYPLDRRPAPSCHASTLAPLPGGLFAAAWFSGSNESNPDVRIWFSVGNAEGWSEPRAVTPDNGIADWNPVLYAEGMNITLYYKEGLSPRTWITMVVRSRDGGKSFDQPRPLVEGDSAPRGPVKNKIIRLAGGELLAPSSVEDGEHRWMAFTDLSYDNGASWRRGAYVPFAPPDGGDPAHSPDELPPECGGMIQPTLWQTPDGSVHMFVRTSFGRIYRADSDDLGNTWSCAEPTALPNNNSGIDVVRTDSGVLALVYNPVESNWGKRTPIRLALSPDDGKTWPVYADLDTEEMEYSYPAIVADGGKLHITYTYNRDSVRYVEAEITF